MSPDARHGSLFLFLFIMHLPVAFLNHSNSIFNILRNFQAVFQGCYHYYYFLASAVHLESAASITTLPCPTHWLLHFQLVLSPSPCPLRNTCCKFCAFAAKVLSPSLSFPPSLPPFLFGLPQVCVYVCVLAGSRGSFEAAFRFFFLLLFDNFIDVYKASWLLSPFTLSYPTSTTIKPHPQHTHACTSLSQIL